MYFKRKELEKFRSFKGPLIDVRSPSEYYKGLNFFKTCNIQPAAQSSPSLSKISNSEGPRLKIFSTSDSN